MPRLWVFEHCSIYATKWNQVGDSSFVNGLPVMAEVQYRLTLKILFNPFSEGI